MANTTDPLVSRIQSTNACASPNAFVSDSFREQRHDQEACIGVQPESESEAETEAEIGTGKGKETEKVEEINSADVKRALQPEKNIHSASPGEAKRAEGSYCVGAYSLACANLNVDLFETTEEEEKK